MTGIQYSAISPTLNMTLMNIILTGAGGFVGQLLTQKIIAKGFSHLTLIDLNFATRPYEDSINVTYLQGQLSDKILRQQAFANGCDVLYHLAAVPGGAAEANPALSKEVNLETTMTLFEEAASLGTCPRVVYTSSIAVLGAPMPELVDDLSPIVPAMTYGTHKAMIELFLADMTRRHLLDSVAVRLPGILARPNVANGLKSAFMSNIFHAAKAGEGFVCPVSEQATMWLMSVEQCTDNLLHASTLDSQTMPTNRVVTFPALRDTMANLAKAVYAACGQDDSKVSYEPDAVLEANFGDQPPLQTPAAEKAGFKHDGDLTTLVANAFTTIA